MFTRSYIGNNQSDLKIKINVEHLGFMHSTTIHFNSYKNSISKIKKSDDEGIYLNQKSTLKKKYINNIAVKSF